MDEEDEHSPSEFYYPEDLETFDAETETGITESQEAIDDFLNQQKSANTNKKTATEMNSLLRYMEANGQERGHPRAFHSQMSCQFLQKIPQSPASGNEGTRITVLLSGPP